MTYPFLCPLMERDVPRQSDCECTSYVTDSYGVGLLENWSRMKPSGTGFPDRMRYATAQNSPCAPFDGRTAIFCQEKKNAQKKTYSAGDTCDITVLDSQAMPSKALAMRTAIVACEPHSSGLKWTISGQSQSLPAQLVSRKPKDLTETALAHCRLRLRTAARAVPQITWSP